MADATDQMTGDKAVLAGAARERASSLFAEARDLGHKAAAGVAPVTSVVTRLGWSVLIGGVVAWWVGAWFGWVELRIVGFACLLLFVLCIALTLGRTLLKVDLEVDPHRVVAGESSAGQVSITNISRVRLLPIRLELPVGSSSARFNLPSLQSGGEHSELFVIPTSRRSVIPVGPAMTVRGDPLGLLRRSVPWSETTELFAHPVTVPLESLGSGLLRDLEGATTQDISMSDLAFHALRDYAPGDDRRHIHWRSSAKIGSSVPGGKFLVRQFLDTRRSHLTVVIDGNPSAYLDDEDFETAVSVGASITARSIRDDMDTTLVVADQAAHKAGMQATLDRCSAAKYGVGGDLVALAGKAVALAPETSLAVLVTGVHSDHSVLRRAAIAFPQEVTTVALRIDTSRPVGFVSVGAITVLSLPHLGDLAALLRGSGLQ